MNAAPRLAGEHAWRVPVALFLVGLVARVATALPFLQPGYPDATYYTEVARSIAAGRGFEIAYVWNFVDVGGRIPDAATLPIASNAHWMPLASIVQVPFVWVLGPTWLAAVLPFWLLGALAVPITYALGLDAGLGRRTSMFGALLMVLPGGAAAYLSQPDNFSLYLVLGVTALWLCVRATRGDRRAFVAGGAVVGLAMLARTDGVLLGVPFVVVFARERWAAWRGRAEAPPAAGVAEVAAPSVAEARAAGDAEVRAGQVQGGPAAPDARRAPGGRDARDVPEAPRPPAASVAGRIGWGPALACFALFVLVMAPWWIRDLSVFGSISPSSSNGRILWIRTYEQLFSAGEVTTPATFFAQGAGSLLASRIGGLVVAIQVLAATPLVLFLAPFCLIGWWRHRRSPAFMPWAVYALTFLLFAGVVFAVHLPYGMALHSEMALVPHAYLLSVVGIGAAVDWVARRRPRWNAATATRNFSVLAIAATWTFAGAASVKQIADWKTDADLRATLLSRAAIPATDRLMSPDPGAFWYTAGIAGVITPNDPLDIVESAARQYHVRWLEIEQDHAVPSLVPVLGGRVHPAWLSAPVATVPADRGTAAGSSPRAALYAVCLDAGDTRCAAR